MKAISRPGTDEDEPVQDLFFVRLQLLKVLWLFMARRAQQYYDDPEEMLNVLQLPL